MTKEDILQALRLTAMGRYGHDLQVQLAEKLEKVFARAESFDADVRAVFDDISYAPHAAALQEGCGDVPIKIQVIESPGVKQAKALAKASPKKAD